jgi:hypothetical protein
VKNPVFKSQVAAAFEKLAFGRDPSAVAAAVSPELREHILRGLSLEKGMAGAARTSDRLLYGTGNLAEKALTSGSELGAQGLGHASNFIMKHPVGAMGTAALAPILLKSFDKSQRRNERDLMTAYHDPSQEVLASLDEFLEKKAAAAAPFSVGQEVTKGLISSGVGLLTGMLAGTLGHSLSNMGNTLFKEPKRKALLDSLFKSDPVIKDALARHPDSQTMLLEAYGTMVKFAPHLSLDINATRSFLREAVLGGSGVNYATIKNLVDTEKSISESKPHFGGKH